MNAIVLFGMPLLCSHQYIQQMEAPISLLPFAGPMQAKTEVCLQDPRPCMISPAQQTSPDQNDRVGLLTCKPTCAGPEPALAATGRDAAGAATGALLEAAAAWLAPSFDAALSAAAASRMLLLAANGSFAGASADK